MYEKPSNPNHAHEIVRIISFLERRRRRFMNEGLRAYGLHGTMFMYIVTLDNFPGSSQDFLSEHLSIDKSNVARTAKRLENEGFIVREVSSFDRRQYCMYLTDKGKEVLPLIRSLLNEWSVQASAGLSPESKALAVDVLAQMLFNVTSENL